MVYDHLRKINAELVRSRGIQNLRSVKNAIKIKVYKNRWNLTCLFKISEMQKNNCFFYKNLKFQNKLIKCEKNNKKN